MVKRRLKNIPIHELAGIQYVGLNGVTQSCTMAVAQQLSNLDEMIQKAALLTCDSRHAFLLFTEHESIIAVKAGFSSGYSGEGPHGLAASLMLLSQRELEINEYIVDEGFFERLEYSCLRQRDIDAIMQGKPIRPSRWYDYVHPYKDESDLDEASGLSRYYPSVIPFEIIDKRIVDLAFRFRGNEDTMIIRAFRRLEDILRKRTGIAGEGVKLFSKVFLSENPSVLRWDVPDDAESKGRGNLFTASYMAFRNARVHREVDSRGETALREFLMVNELYRLEGLCCTNRGFASEAPASLVA